MDQELSHLFRTVTRAFYPYQCVVILDAIIYHSVVYEADLIKLCAFNKKQFSSFLAILLEDRLVVSYTQKEEVTQRRLLTRTYYYIHYIEAVDSIKWKIHALVKRVKDEISQFSDPQGYVCPTCNTKYSLIDAASLFNEAKEGFECSVCGDVLIDDDSGLEARKGQEKLEKLMTQLDPVIQSLKRIDGMRVEDNTFETSLIKLIPSQTRSEATYSVFNKVARKQNNFNNGFSQSLKNAAKKSQATIHVNITADDESLQKQQDEEIKNEKRRQNALPSWHMESTVGQSALGKLNDEGEEDENNENGTPDVEVKKEDSPSVKLEDSQGDDVPTDDAEGATGNGDTYDKETIDAVNAYYAQLKAKEQKEDMEEDEEEDELGEDEFEDIDNDEFEDIIEADEEEAAAAAAVANATVNATATAGSGSASTNGAGTGTTANNGSNVASRSEVRGESVSDEDEDIDEAMFEDIAD